MNYSIKSVTSIIMALRSDSAGNSQATMTEMDAAANMLAALLAQRDQLLAALEIAHEALDNAKGDINPERGYADELEEEVAIAAGTAASAIAAAKAGGAV